ncbi:MAG: hypothetical protein JXA30_13045 [Deltaproteobacteria bacterium]|nr:hypothetical protein [Deltaproteobacteria bacterium]
MKRFFFSLLLLFAFATTVLGCLAGPGVEPPRTNFTEDKSQEDAGSTTGIPGQNAAATGGSGGMAGAVDMNGETQAGKGGSGGESTVPSMDAGAQSDGAIAIDSAISDSSAEPIDEALDDAGSELRQ